jgi:hypothetical protein
VRPVFERESRLFFMAGVPSLRRMHPTQMCKGPQKRKGFVRPCANQLSIKEGCKTCEN